MIKWINKYKNCITALSGILITLGFILKTSDMPRFRLHSYSRDAHRGGSDRTQSLSGTSDEGFQHRVVGDDRRHRCAVHP